MIRIHFYVLSFFVSKIAFIHFVIFYLQYFSEMLALLIRISWDFIHLYSYKKINVAKCFESRYLQKLVLHKIFILRPLSAKISSAKINAVLIVFVCLFQLFSSTETDRRALKYLLKWQWCEWVEVNEISPTHPRKEL